MALSQRKPRVSKSPNLGGKRSGAGRPAGSLGKRSVEAIKEVAERYPNWSPLLHFAAVANDDAMPADIRLDAAKAAAPFIHPRPKHIELDPDALVELEGRVAAARAQSIKEHGHDLSGLADHLAFAENMGERLRRAKKRIADMAVIDVPVATQPMPALAAPAPAPAAPVAQPVPTPSPAPTPVAPLGSDWGQPGAPTYSPIFPLQQDFADCDYASLSDGLIATRNK